MFLLVRLPLYLTSLSSQGKRIIALSDTLDFEHMLGAGLGRAVLHLQQHDPIPLRPIILNACLHNITLYRQLEGTRVKYLLDVLDATKEIEYYRPKILDALESLTESAD